MPTTRAEPLRDALVTALSVALHEEADPECAGQPLYEQTAAQAERVVAAVMRTPLVQAALTAADPAPAGASGDVEAMIEAVRFMPERATLSGSRYEAAASEGFISRAAVLGLLRAAPATPLEPLDVGRLARAMHATPALFCIRNDQGTVLCRGADDKHHIRDATAIVQRLQARPTDTEPSGS